MVAIKKTIGTHTQAQTRRRTGGAGTDSNRNQCLPRIGVADLRILQTYSRNPSSLSWPRDQLQKNPKLHLLLAKSFSLPNAKYHSLHRPKSIVLEAFDSWWRKF